MKKKEQKLLNTNAITRHNAIAIFRDQQSWGSSFSLIQTCLQLIKIVDETDEFAAIPILLLYKSLENQIKSYFFTPNAGWFLLRRFIDLVRVCSLHITSRNHSNTLLLINSQKTKTCPK